MDSVALFSWIAWLCTNGFSGSIFMDWVAPPPWNIQFDVICEKIKENSVLSIQGCSTKLQDVIKIVFESQEQCVEFDKLFKEFSYIQTYSFEENGYFNGLIMDKK